MNVISMHISWLTLAIIVDFEMVVVKRWLMLVAWLYKIVNNTSITLLSVSIIDHYTQRGVLVT